MEGFLGGGDLGMSLAVHDGLEVGAAGEEPGGVGVAEVVDSDVEVDAGGFDGGQPGPGAEGVPRDRVRSRVANSRSSGATRRVVIESVSSATRSAERPMVRGSLSLG